MERKRRFQTRQQYAEEKAKLTKFDKLNKYYLNYLIAIVAILIVVTLWMLISGDDKSDKNVAQTPDQAEKADKNVDDATDKDKTEDEQTTENEANDETTEETEAEPVSENTVDSSTDSNVAEVQTNPNWEAYPTEQTGEHVSTFEKGDIDYEEKLKAIFSVTDLQQDNSFIWSVRNNGSTQSAIGVVSSRNKEKIYRVSIEWVDGQGWKPVKLEVLNSLEGYE